jgi:hypothetical protein
MSASDAAPLPRLGEVFFDVRGSSRSMRLSWYADTDVAVFSIWQGGRCTGTFRLPIADLGRMIEILQRGPHDRRLPEGPAGYRSELDEFDGRPRAELGPPDQSYRDRDFGDRDARDRDVRDRDLQQTQAAGSDWGAGDDTESSRRAGARGSAWAARSGDYQEDDYPGRGGSDRDYRGQESADGYAGRRDHGESDYWDDNSGYQRSADGRGRFAGGEPAGADLPGPGFGDGRVADPRFADAEFADADFGRGFGDADFADASGAGYGDERFVPPYVRGQDETYLNDNTVVAPGERRGYDPRAYPDDRQAPSRRGSHHREPSWSEDPYYDEPEYRLSADAASGQRDSAGRHAGR